MMYMYIYIYTYGNNGLCGYQWALDAENQWGLYNPLAFNDQKPLYCTSEKMAELKCIK